MWKLWDKRFDKSVTLDEAKNWVDVTSKQTSGCICPGCGGKAKEYRRPINRSMGRCLAALQAAVGGDVTKSAHKDALYAVMARLGWEAKLLDGGSYGKLQYWGLVRPKQKDRGDTSKKDSGAWLITEKGIKLLQGQLKVPHKVIIYQDKVQGFDSSETWDIHDIMKEYFDFGKLMRT